MELHPSLLELGRTDEGLGAGEICGALCRGGGREGAVEDLQEGPGDGQREHLWI
jgi:hypothetical protein